MKTLLKQDLRNLIHSSGNVVMFLFFPLICILLFGFLFENSFHSSMLSSYDFYGVTMILYTTMMASTVPANAFLEKNIKAGNTRIFYSPVSRVKIYLSKIIASFLFVGICVTINILLLNATSFVNFGSGHLLEIIFLMLNFILFLITLGSAICVSLKSEEYTNTILSNLMAVLGVLSGIFFPVASLGPVFEKVSNISPVKWIVTSIFELIYDKVSSVYPILMIGLLVLSGIFLFIVHKNYNPKDYV